MNSIQDALDISRKSGTQSKLRLRCSKRIQELDGIVAALTRALELIKEEDKGVANVPDK